MDNAGKRKGDHMGKIMEKTSEGQERVEWRD